MNKAEEVYNNAGILVIDDIKPTDLIEDSLKYITDIIIQEQKESINASRQRKNLFLVFTFPNIPFFVVDMTRYSGEFNKKDVLLFVKEKHKEVIADRIHGKQIGKMIEKANRECPFPL